MTSGKSFNCLRQAALITVIAAVLFSVSPVLGLAFALGIVYRLLLAKPVAAAALPVPPAHLTELVIEIDAAKRERCCGGNHGNGRFPALAATGKAAEAQSRTLKFFV